MNFQTYLQKSMRHPWLTLILNVETVLVFGAPLLVIILDAYHGVMRSSAEYDALFAWWPYAFACLLATVIWFNICEIEPLVQIIYLLPRLLFFGGLYLLRYVPILGAVVIWIDERMDRNQVEVIRESDIA